MANQIGNAIADVLLTALSRFRVSGNDKGMHDYLRAHPVKFVKDGILHQVFDFDRGQGAWVGACGTPYEGNGYAETSTPGDSTCVSCIAEE